MKTVPFLTESFGETLKMYRERSKLTQKELATKIGGARSYIAYLEHGQKVPTLTTLHLLCDALDVDLHEFIDAYQTVLNRKRNE